MVELQSNVKQFEKAGITLIGISYDSTEVLSRYTKKAKVSFPLLSDQGSKIIDAFGILNESQRKKGLPHPGTFLIKDGKIVGKLFFEGYRERHASDVILQAVEKL